MNFNKGKTRVMEYSLRKSDDAEGISLGNEAIKVVDECCYLGSKITSDSRRRCKMQNGCGKKSVAEEVKLFDIQYYFKC